MTNEEIKAEIEANDKKIENLINTDIFVLNSEICSLLKRNEQLRQICTHDFQDGRCKFCGKIEK